MTEYAAFLRGINVGGHKKISMEALRNAFAACGFKNIKTVLASGNVVFESPSNDFRALKQSIEAKIKKTFAMDVRVILRSLEELQSLADANPFAKIKITPQTRLYVTFLSEKPTSKLKIPYESPERDFKILRATHSEVCSMLTLSPKRGTVDVMDILEKEFGENITTRNWNTVLRVLQLR
jgi:uncharacterized protein (DUF1697 family)